MPKMIVNDLGPCEVVWDRETLNTGLAPMFGTSLFKSEQLIADLKEEGKGDRRAGAVTIGKECTAEVPMTKSSLTQLQQMIYGSVLGSGSGGPNLKVKNTVGEDLADYAKSLTLKPVVNNVAVTDESKWITIFKAHPVEKMELGFDNAGQRVVLVEFISFPDTASGNVGEVYRWGTA